MQSYRHLSYINNTLLLNILCVYNKTTNNKATEQKNVSLSQVWKDLKYFYKTLKKSQTQLRNMEDPLSLTCKLDSKVVFHILVISQKLHSRKKEVLSNMESLFSPEWQGFLDPYP